MRVRLQLDCVCLQINWPTCGCVSANVFIAVCDLTRLFADRFCIVLRLFDLIGLTGYSARDTCRVRYVAEWSNSRRPRRGAICYLHS